MAVVLLAAKMWIKRITKPKLSEITTLINMEMPDATTTFSQS